jgi:uncharacterized membrane protein (DUF485 family)
MDNTTRYIKEEQDKQDKMNNLMMIITLVLIILFISSISHAAVKLSFDKVESNKIIRIILMCVAVFLFPFYWIIYPIVLFSGNLQ